MSAKKTQATKKYIDHPSVTLGLCPVYVAQKAYEGTGRRPWGSADITVDVRLDWRNATRLAREFISTLKFHRPFLFARSGPLCPTCSVGPFCLGPVPCPPKRTGASRLWSPVLQSDSQTTVSLRSLSTTLETNGSEKGKLHLTASLCTTTFII